MSPTPARERTRLAECSSEPIRTPGTIQPHGLLLAVDRESRLIVVVSENSGEFLQATPAQVLGRTVEEFFGEESIPALLDAASGANPAPVEVDGAAYDAIVHRDGPLTFVELEPRVTEGTRDREAAVYAATQRLSRLTDRPELLVEVTREFERLTGFDRVMVYHFHPDGHGEVVSEVHADGMEPYLGLHFPASDIPIQARDLYLTKLSRAIVSTVTPPVGLVGTSARTLDLTHAELRAVSPFHLQFMRNMGQASTVSFSLIYRGELIGMITCAHRTERRLPFITRRSLEMLSNQIALQLGATGEISVLQERVRSQQLRTHLLSKIVASDDLASALLEGDFTVLDVVPADAAGVCLDGRYRHTDAGPDVAAMDDLLTLIPPSQTLFVCDSLAAVAPEIAATIPQIAGVLIVRLGDEGDFLALFRREVVQSTDWLGDLTEQNRTEILSPRLSFSAWRESVTGRSLPWGRLADDALLLGADLMNALLRREHARLATLAMHDPLTGLGNRRLLMDELDRVSGRELSLLFIDLDEFKAINDTHGHEAGDLVIVETGRRLVEQTRADDRVARLGGDEFVILCENTPRRDAEALAERIGLALRSPIGPFGATVTASIGIVSVTDAADAAELLERADAAMYRAKNSGRDTVSF